MEKGKQRDQGKRRLALSVEPKGGKHNTTSTGYEELDQLLRTLIQAAERLMHKLGGVINIQIRVLARRYESIQVHKLAHTNG